MKYLITYDTTNGDILSVDLRDTEEVIVSSGIGTLIDNVLTSSEPMGAHIYHQVTIEVDGRKMRSGITSVDSSTQITLTRPINTNGAQVEASYKICAYQSAASFSLSEADNTLTVKKSQGIHQNIAALCLTTKLMIASHTHYVDVADGNKIKSKDDQITYE